MLPLVSSVYVLKREPDPSEWYPVAAKEAMGKNRNMKFYLNVSIQMFWMNATTLQVKYLTTEGGQILE